MDSSEDDYSAIMLISLSRIASRWMLLVPTQMELLMLFQSEDRSLHVQATSLRCFHFMLARGGVSIFSSSTGTVLKLFDMLHKSELQSTLQLEYLRILYKILLINVSIIPCVEIPEIFQKLFLVIKNMLQSSAQSNRVLAISILADLSEKVVGRQDMWSDGSASGCTLASQVISFVLDQVLSLLTAKNGINLTDYAVELEVRSLLKTLFNLVGKTSNLHCLVLSNVCLFVCNLMKMIDRAMNLENTVMSIPEMTVSGLTLVESKVILSLTKIMAACLETLECIDAETSNALDALKLQVETVCHSSYMGSYTRLMNFLLLHLRSAYICMQNMTENLMSCNNSCLFGVDSIFELDKYILGCAKEMLERKNYWCTYKAGKNAACQGGWSTAGFIFEHLMESVQSPSCFGWLKSLAQFSSSEHQVQLFLLSGQGTFTVPGGSGLREMGVSTLRTRSCKYMENLLRGSHAILCAEEILGAPDMGNIFSFQRWFLILRAKGLKYVADMMKLLDSISSIQDGTRSGVELDRGTLSSCTTSWTLGPLIKSCMEVSCHMQQLAEEFDLLLTSFVGMDQQSVMSVSALALSCSIMAFTAGFAFLVSDSYSPENYRVPESGYLEGPLHALLIEDLLGRLKHIDCKTRKNLLLLLKPFRNSNRCSLSRFKTQTCYYETEVLHKLCEFSVGEVCSLRNEAARTQDADALYRILNNGSELLMKIISNLMSIPFHTPQHFFRVRSAVSSELFVMNEDGQVLDGSSISLGSLLSLNLSFQLKNIPAGLPFPTKKVYCILSCKPHSSVTTKVGDSKGQARLRKQEDEMHNIMELNKELLRYVTTGRSCRRRDDNRLKVTEYACFELNEGGQGFSTCFLDISVLGVGDYRITWHCGYIDSGGSYCTLLPVNDDGPFITIKNDVNV